MNVYLNEVQALIKRRDEVVARLAKIERLATVKEVQKNMAKEKTNKSPPMSM